MFLVSVLFYCGLLVASAIAEEKCQIVFPHRGGGFRPLVYDGDETELLMENHEGVMKVATGNAVVLTCKQHELSGETDHKLTAKCNDGQFLDTNGENISPSEIECQLRVLELSPVISPQCTGSLAQYQFHDKGSEEKNIVAETCYDTARNIPIYSHYKVSSPPHFLENSNGLSKAPYMSAVDILSTYRSDEINRKVTKVLGDGHIMTDNVLYTVSLIPKEHVHSQFKDVSRRAHNLVTFWDNVMYGNYENLIQDIRKLRKNQRVFEIYAGVSQTAAQLPNIKGKLVELYLRTTRTTKSFPVPEYYWAVVYEKQTEKAIAFIIYNNMEGAKTDPICISICEDVSWVNNLHLNDNYKNVEIGQTLCCEFKEFSKTMDHISVLKDVVVKDGIEGILRE